MSVMQLCRMQYTLCRGRLIKITFVQSTVREGYFVQLFLLKLN